MHPATHQALGSLPLVVVIACGVGAERLGYGSKWFILTLIVTVLAALPLIAYAARSVPRGRLRIATLLLVAVCIPALASATGLGWLCLQGGEACPLVPSGVVTALALGVLTVRG